MSNSDSNYDQINDYNAVRITLADPNRIRTESKGEVKKPETINYRSYKPEKDGLFCERIFGPQHDYECSCGKYRGIKYKGMVCDRCGVKLTTSKVRRQRMGHIDLAAPVVHIWFFKATPCRLASILPLKSTELEKIIYFNSYVVTESGQSGLRVGELLNEEEYGEVSSEFRNTGFKAEMGAEAIRTLLKNLKVVDESKKLRRELEEYENKAGKKRIREKQSQKIKDLVNHLEHIEDLRNCGSGNKPEWMVLDVIPVIPPDLRPLIMLENGSFASSDLNDLYRRIINRNNRLKKLIDLNAPDVIVRNEKRMLQQAVDALIDNKRVKRSLLGQSSRPLKSLTDLITGKQGRFRENLLGKRVDYSARSVIVVGPYLHLHQCGLPKKIALELYQPFIIRRLKELQHADTIKSAKKMLERKDEEVWDILEEVIQNHPVLLNRAPTLHRMGIQAFEPVLVEGNAIKLHPLVCKGFNADFDGDQMAVHLPLSLEAQVEAHTLMLSTNNIFSPANGRPIISPSQDMVMGCYYITIALDNMKGEGMIFSNKDEVLLAYSLGKVHLQAKIKVRMAKNRWIEAKGDKNNPDSRRRTVTEGMLFETTPGRIIFNEILSDGMPFYNVNLRSSELAGVISDCHEYLGRKATIDLLDRMMRIGFEESTKSGLSFATDDLITPSEKKRILDEAEKQVQALHEQYEQGLLNENKRKNDTIDIWTKAGDLITKKMMEGLKNDKRTDQRVGYVNPIYLMKDSGARGGQEQIRQLAGLRGLMAKPNGEIIETPVKANFREGLSVLEYFSSTHGARKGLADTALKTAESGYLTRKLIDVSQNTVITMYDCGTKEGIFKGVISEGDRISVPISDIIIGRVSRQNIADPTTDEIVVRENDMITAPIAKRLEEMGISRIKVRSPLTCEAPLGICALCYGMDLSTSRLVEEGMAVGIIAAQSIGEPGTQLTMRTFHIGGTASHSAESNLVKTQFDGIVKFDGMEVVECEGEGGKTFKRVFSCKPDGGVSILRKGGDFVRRTYHVPEGAQMKVAEGDEVHVDDTLCTYDPHLMMYLAQYDGVVQFEGIEEGSTAEANGTKLKIKSKITGQTKPKIILNAKKGKKELKELDRRDVPANSEIEVKDGEFVKKGTVLFTTPKSVAGTKDITSGLPRVTELFEAREPKNPGVIAEIAGVVVDIDDKTRRKLLTIHPNGVDDDESDIVHEIPASKNLVVKVGDEVKEGQLLTDGFKTPRDILRIQGREALQTYLVNEVQEVYRGQNVRINDKHIEIIVTQMLRRQKVRSAGDTDLIKTKLVDKRKVAQKNREILDSVKIVDPGDSLFQEGDIVPRAIFERIEDELAAEGKRAPKAEDATPATVVDELLGITKAAVLSDSFISAASFQETTKVLTKAALEGREDPLEGLKENVILGRLIPAGTGFQKYRDAQWRHYPEVADRASHFGYASQPHSYALLQEEYNASTEAGAADTGGGFSPVADEIPDQPADKGENESGSAAE